MTAAAASRDEAADLAAAILTGIRRRPVQSFGEYFGENGGSDALGAAYEGLLRDAEDGSRTVIDTYGAKNPAEFFAVVTEAFFERPKALHARHPALYAQMREFYQQDPLALGAKT